MPNGRQEAAQRGEACAEEIAQGEAEGEEGQGPREVVLFRDIRAHLTEQKRQEWFLGEVDAVYEAVRERRHRRLTVVAKPFSTMTIAHLTIVEKGDHSLEIAGDVPRSLGLPSTYFTCLVKFLGPQGKRCIRR